jgi:hypothetical protein
MWDRGRGRRDKGSGRSRYFRYILPGALLHLAEINSRANIDIALNRLMWLFVDPKTNGLEQSVLILSEISA